MRSSYLPFLAPSILFARLFAFFAMEEFAEGLLHRMRNNLHTPSKPAPFLTPLDNFNSLPLPAAPAKPPMRWEPVSGGEVPPPKEECIWRWATRVSCTQLHLHVLCSDGRAVVQQLLLSSEDRTPMTKQRLQRQQQAQRQQEKLMKVDFEIESECLSACSEPEPS